MQEGFYFNNPKEASEFFERCIAANAQTLEERMVIMRQMVKEKKAKYIRDAEEFAKGKNVTKLRPNGEINENTKEI